jgi:hypothetical protein
MRKKKYIASCSFGKDSIATILLALENNEPLDRVVFAEVMFDNERGISGEIPEHIDWIHNIAIPKLAEIGVRVDIVRAKKDYVSLCRQVLKSGKNEGKCYGVQNSRPCYANSDLKIAPIRQYINRMKKEYDVVQYVGITIDEPERLERLRGKNKVSLLEKYGYTKRDSIMKCVSYGLLSPLYKEGCRGGCFFCFFAEIDRYIKIRKNYPHYWQALKDLYHETKSQSFKYGKTLEQVEKEMDVKELNDRLQLRFDF